MAKSDGERSTDSAEMIDITMAPVYGEPTSLDGKDNQTIHSGHFMVSDVHNNEVDDEEAEAVAESKEGSSADLTDMLTPEMTIKKEFALKRYEGTKWDPAKVSIDASLTKLFECMTLAYSGKLTSPRWKTFKGLKLMLKDKIRLNNIIWREWHMQYVQAKLPIICQFAAPIGDETHTKPEAVVLEGKYWKRRLESVTAEYKRWRTFFKEKLHRGGGVGGGHPSSLGMSMQEVELLERVAHHDIFRFIQPQSSPQQTLMGDDDFMMDFSDTLFSSLNQPFAFPNPKEMAQLTNADFIQPGLVQLQPSLDDFMDTLDPLQEMFSSSRPSSSFNNMNITNSVPAPDNILANQQVLQGDTTPQNVQISEAAAMDLLTTVSPGTSGGVFGNQSAQSSSNSSSSSSIYGQHGMGDINMSLFNTLQQPTIVTQQQMQQVQAQQQQQQRQQQAQALAQAQTQAQAQAQAQVQARAQAQQQQVQAQAQIQAQAQAQAQARNLAARPDLQSQLQSETFQTQTLNLTSASSGVTVAGAMPLQQQLTQTLLSQALGVVAPPTGTATNQTLVQQNPAATVLTITPGTAAALLKPDLSGKVHTAAALQGASLLPAGTVFTVQAAMPVKPAQAAVATPSVSTVTVPRRGSGGASNKQSLASKKSGDFVVPKGKPSITRKPRMIVPAPAAGMASAGAVSPPAGSSSIAQQNTFLATLLTKGTYKGSNLKSESAPKSCSSSSGSSPKVQFTPIRPAITTTTNTLAAPHQVPVPPPVTFTLDTSSVSELQRNMLCVAASKVVGTTCVQSADSPLHTDSLYPNSDSNPSSPAFQDQNASVDLSASPGKFFRPKSEADRQTYKEHRRVSHISAEQKRRFNIKSGFDTLHQLVPALRENPNHKISKAATLQKAADFCKKLKMERSQMQDESEVLRKEIESLNSSISNCQAQLPATGVPVTRQRVDQMKEMFDKYVKTRTERNWKFWIFSIIIRNLFDTYNSMVSTASLDELCRTVLSWLDQHCSLVSLRPTVLNALRHLSTTTSILSDPSKVPEQAAAAVTDIG